ncbi:hypothetical protein QKC54_gp0172 [Megavirus baoshan]|uniref:Uncharacterized protein n=1 Tax=Megavirus baoshan TaxID=2496520 RepID=A0A8K1T1A6_9VIRU|nr:hypothetical protein QKC54_gp0172 [Megavirus baoshan]UFX99890.1 hypothetical protein Mb0900 [Megavirus baoshan]
MSSYHCSSYLIFLNNTKNQFKPTQIFNNYTKSIKSPKPRSTWFPIK